MPEDPRGDGSVGTPTPRVARRLGALRCSILPPKSRECQVERQIARRPDVRTSQHHQEINARAPWPDPPHARERRECVSVGQASQPREVERAVRRRRGERSEVRRLLSRETERPEPLLASACDACGADAASDRPIDAPEQGRRRLDRHLLFEDDERQGTEAPTPSPEWWWPVPRDDGAESRVLAAELADGGGECLGVECWRNGDDWLPPECGSGSVQHRASSRLDAERHNVTSVRVSTTPRTSRPL